MEQVLLVIHLLVAIGLIGLILLQRSEGGALGIGGGGNSGGNIFSARGVGNTLTRATAILAVGFFLTSIALTMFSSHQGKRESTVFTETPAEKAAPGAPVANGTPAAPSSNDGVQLPKLGQEAPAAPATNN